MIGVWLGVLGVICGSFVNALVWRLHEQEVVATRSKSKARGVRSGGKQSITAEDLSVLQGRSMCPDCHHPLAAKDLVPVLSWLWLGRKCRYCRRPISWQYPAVEVVTGILFVVSYLAWPSTLTGVGLYQFVLWLVFVAGFVALAVYDLRWMLLPNRIVLPLIALAGLQTIVVALWRADWAGLYVPLLSAGIIFGLFWLLYQVSKGTWIGGGDVKLVLVLGLLAATPLRALLVVFGASLLGTLGSLPALVKGKRGLHLRVPFGPYLLLATVLVVLWGQRLLDWYTSLVFPY